jgi:glutathionylspermidine synthase
MKRISVRKRDNWQQRLEDIGFTFHSIDGTYWNEGFCYEFSAGQIDRIEAATQELQEMAVAVASRVIGEKLYSRIGIPERFIPLVEASWDRDDPSIYGRFDLSYDGRDTLKLLEYNADTPTSLVEAGVAQWVWLEEMMPDADQFNSIHERLIDSFAEIRETFMPFHSRLHFTCVRDSREDFVNVEYLRDTAVQAGISTKHLFIDDIGYSDDDNAFCDLENEEIRFLFKLYPWEWLVSDEFGENLLDDTLRLFEPPWKMILSNKGILPLLWEQFPGHPLLLESYFSPERLERIPHVRKPLLSREGANIRYRDASGRIHETDGEYGEEGYIYQKAQPLPRMDGSYPVIGSWVIGGEAAGMGIREDDTPITKNTSRFVPHYFK